MVRYFVLDDAGEPVEVENVLEWAFAFESIIQSGRKRLARDVIREPNGEDGGVVVSTVFLGLDHRFRIDPNDPTQVAPVLWETMVFGGVMDQEQERYCTRQEALEGHARILAEVRQAEGL